MLELLHAGIEYLGRMKDISRSLATVEEEIEHNIGFLRFKRILSMGEEDILNGRV